MNGIIHVIGQNYREYWIDGQGVTMMEKSGFNAVRNGQTLTIYRENGVATEIDGAILVEILEATPKTVETMTNEKGMSTLANMIITGKLLKEVPMLGFDNIDAPLSKVVSARHQDLLEVNKTALKLGYDY